MLHVRPPSFPTRRASDLGRRLAEIAAEKAAIIKGGVALSAAQAPEAMEVIAARCRALDVPLLVEDRELRVEVLRSDLQGHRSEEHTSELQSLMRISYAVFCLKKKKKHK